MPLTSNSKTFTVRYGDVEVRKAGQRWVDFRDPYHLILRLSWPAFFLGLLASFVLVNLAFAAAYHLVDGSIANARPGSFADAFFFSIETLATVGYGAMSPAGYYGHAVASVEIFLGMVTLALVTGLIFARFSKPMARILFSDKLLLREFEGRPALMLRIANDRHNRIVEATAALSLLRLESVGPREAFYRIHDLPLLRSSTPVFALTWTLIHRIDADSPLHGWDVAALRGTRGRITVSVTGHDETVAAPVHAINEYSFEDLLDGYRFADVIDPSAEGSMVVDMTRFHDVIPQDED